MERGADDGDGDIALMRVAVAVVVMALASRGDLARYGFRAPSDL